MDDVDLFGRASFPTFLLINALFIIYIASNGIAAGKREYTVRVYTLTNIERVLMIGQ